MKWIVVPACLLALAYAPAAQAQDEAPTPDDAQDAYVAGDIERARAIVETLLVADPSDPDLLRRLAMIEAAEGQLDKAQSTIDRALALAPEDSDIQLARANILLWNGDLAPARRQAEAVRAVRPDYPGLAEFDSAAEKASEARRFGLLSLGIGQSFSQTELQSGASQTWSAQNVAVSFGSREGPRATLGIEREKRTAVDTRATARLDFGSSGRRFHVAGSVTPDPDFRESWSLSGGGEFAVGPRSELLLDARFARYRTGDVFILRPGLRQYFGDRFVLTAHAINLFGGGEDYRLGGAVRGDYLFESGAGVFAALASYPDTEADGTRQLRSVAIGTSIPLTERFTARITGEYDTREQSYDRAAIVLGLSMRFGPR